MDLCSGMSLETCFSSPSQPRYEQLFCMCPGSAAAFQKPSLRIRSQFYHEGLCYKDMSWTHEGSERRTKTFVPLQGDAHSQISKLRLLSTSSLYAWCHLPLPEKRGEKKVFLFEKWVFIFFHSLPSWVGHHNTFCASPLVKHDALT